MAEQLEVLERVPAAVDELVAWLERSTAVSHAAAAVVEVNEVSHSSLVSLASAGGNSGNAQACQQGGWQNLVREDGSGFADQSSCVSYGASGGVLFVERPPAWRDVPTLPVVG